MYKESATRVHPGVQVKADSGYQGLRALHGNTVLPFKGTGRKPLTKDERRHNHDHSSLRIFVEHAIRRIKVFRILKETYRNRRRRFGLRLSLIAAIVNMELGLKLSGGVS